MNIKLTAKFTDRLRFLNLVVFAGIFFLFPSLSYSDAKVDVNDIRYWSYPEYTRVVISLSDNAEFQVYSYKIDNRYEMTVSFDKLML